MTKTNILIIIFVMISLQAILTYFQIKDYNKVVKKLKKMGKLGIGNVKGKISKGVVVLLCANENTIVKISKMEGMSVFARFKDTDEFNGMNIEELEKLANDNLAKEDDNYYKAILMAIDMLRKI